ncbi:MAG: hypothetical protein R3F11_29820 [Verrucomicrobiales bacterium]
MKAVLEIPDDLYHQVVARVTAKGQRFQDIAVNLLERWIDADADAGDEASTEGTGDLTEREQWLEDWFRQADEAMAEAPAGPSAREMLL